METTGGEASIPPTLDEGVMEVLVPGAVGERAPSGN